MSDRISGSIQVGGKITQEQFNELCEIIEELSDDDGLSEKGFAYFFECREGDLDNLSGFCVANDITLCITWEAKCDIGGYAEYWSGGDHEEFDVTINGDVCFTLKELAESNTDSIAEFIQLKGVPSIPPLEIIDKKESDFGEITIAEFVTEDGETLNDQDIPMKLWCESISGMIGMHVGAIDRFRRIQKTGTYPIRIAYVDGNGSIQFGRASLKIIDA